MEHVLGRQANSYSKDASTKSLYLVDYMIKRFRVLLPALFATSIVTEAVATQVNDCGEISANASGYINRDALNHEFESAVEEFIRDAELLPGVVIGVVKEDEVIFARGYGFRELLGCAPALPDTRFYLKSTTKSFSGMVAAILHEEGSINLDSPITDYLPRLTLEAPINADQISLADHFTHTQPYRAGGLNFRTAYPGNLHDDQFVDHINEFGTARDISFRYSNEGPIIGMHAIGSRLDRTWRDLIQEEIFNQIGMSDSFTSMTEAERGPIAKSYSLPANGVFRETSTKTDRQFHAAGGAVSTVNDLNRWVMLNLASGRLGDEQLIKKRAVEHAQERLVYLDARFLEFDRFAYGLGLYSSDYDGDLLMHHFGGETHVSFMPEHGIGVVVLTNAIRGGVVVTHRLAASIYDLVLGKPDVDQRIARRLEEIANWTQQSEKSRAEYLAELESYSSGGQASLSINEITVTYTDPRLGSITITGQGSELIGKFGEIDMLIRHIGGDFYSADFGIWGDLPELFRIAKDDSGRLTLDWGGRVFVNRSG